MLIEAVGVGDATAEAIFIAQVDCHPEREVAKDAMEDEMATPVAAAALDMIAIRG